MTTPLKNLIILAILNNKKTSLAFSKDVFYYVKSSYAFLRFQKAFSAIAVKRTSVDEFKAVSQESWITPTIKPTPTTCIARSFEMHHLTI